LKRVGDLFEQIVDFHALREAARRASAGRCHKPAVAAFLFHEERELLRLQRELRFHSYQPGRFTTFVIHDPKRRTISAPPVRDRVVHHALCAAVEPVFERVAIHDSYACRKGKGAHLAVDRAQLFARRNGWFLKMDIARFYDNVDHAVLKGLVRRVLKDPDLLWLLDRIIDHAPPGAPEGKSLPIGNLTSQHLANLYLSGLDHRIKDRLGVRAYIRYMDDLLLFESSKAELWRWRDEVERYAAEHLKLRLKERATLVAPVTEGVPFLGLRVWPSVRRLDTRRRRRLVRKIREQVRQLADGHVESQHVLDSMAATVASSLIADTQGLRRGLVSAMMGAEGRGG
jgi:RNA-directed DNA polymerase